MPDSAHFLWKGSFLSQICGDIRRWLGYVYENSANITLPKYANATIKKGDDVFGCLLWSEPWFYFEFILFISFCRQRFII